MVTSVIGTDILSNLNTVQLNSKILTGQLSKPHKQLKI
jgi:hypothetical protein